MKVRMEPVRVAGVLRPDLDHRSVTRGCMAIYLGVEESTLWRRHLQGDHALRAAARAFGSTFRFVPSVWAEAQRQPVPM